MKLTVKPICDKTHNSHWVRWGRTSTGKPRYRCAGCSQTRVLRRGAARNRRIFQLFRQYILWGVTYQMLASVSGYSTRHLARYFHHWLQDVPVKLLEICKP